VVKRKSFTASQRLKIFLAEDGRCHICGLKIAPGEPWQVDHIKPLGLGGCDEHVAPAHIDCHAGKTRQDVAIMRKADRQGKKHLGLKKSRNPLPGSRGSKFRKRMDGTVEIRK
jgi:5-methylcytosine-specific restriction enzyme A